MVRRRSTIVGSVLRVDAKAEGLTVAVGGWAPVRNDKGETDVSGSPWFSLALAKDNAAWAFVKGEQARAFSTLELLANTVGLVLLPPGELDAPGAAGTVAMMGLTDA